MLAPTTGPFFSRANLNPVRRALDQGWIAHGGREQTPPGEVIPMRFSSVHCRPDATGVVRGRAHDEYERNTR